MFDLLNSKSFSKLSKAKGVKMSHTISNDLLLRKGNPVINVGFRFKRMSSKNN